jgi:hypothetical protein
MLHEIESIIKSLPPRTLYKFTNEEIEPIKELRLHGMPNRDNIGFYRF